MSVSRRGGLLAISIVATAAIVGGLWYYTEHASSYLVVSLPDILTRFQQMWLFDRFSSDFLPSMQRLVTGYALSCVLGVLLGLGIGLMPVVRALTNPVVWFLRAIPPIALLPAALIVLGFNNTARVTIIAFVCIWPILLNTADGVAELDRTMLASARAYGITGMERLRTVILPAVLPRIFTGMRTSLTFAILLMVTSEFIASTEGIGTVLLLAQQNFQITDMWSAVVLLGLMSVILNLAFGMVERRVLHWHFRAENR